MSGVEKDPMLEAFIAVAPIIPMFFKEPISIAVTDRENFVLNVPSPEIPLKCELGKPFPKESTAHKAILAGEIIVKEMPKDIYGIPFKSYAVPIKNKAGKVVGCALLAKSIEMRSTIKTAIEELSGEIDDVSTAVNELSAGIQTSSENMLHITTLMSSLLLLTNRMGEILQLIHQVSNSTKMLGVNASIEAARAGESGRGFTIVAKEIQRMSLSTNESAKTIGNLVEEIKGSLKSISDDVQVTTSVFSEQAATLEEIAASTHELSENVKIIDKYTKRL